MPLKLKKMLISYINMQTSIWLFFFPYLLGGTGISTTMPRAYQHLCKKIVKKHCKWEYHAMWVDRTEDCYKTEID